MTDLNIFLNKDLSADDVLHSNAMGAVAGGGAAGGLSIEKRRQLLNRPRVIGSYEHSARVARQQGTFARPQTFAQQQARGEANNGAGSAEIPSSNRQQGGIQSRNQIDNSIDRRQRFNEPKGRSFDKFS